MSDTTGRNSIYFPSLTGLRAVAAFLVFFSHYPIPAKRVGSLIYSFTTELYIGVNIFFVLSGFLIAIRYQEDIKLIKSNLLHYLQNRFARIYPMYFILTTLAFIYNNYAEHGLLFTYFMNITFLRGFFDDLIITGIIPGWTLTVEESFYLLAPFIFYFNRRIKAIWMMLVLYLIGLLLVTIFKHVNFLGFFNSYQFMFIKTFPGRCFEFFIGMTMAKLYKKSWRPALLKRNCTLTGALGILITVIILMSLKDIKARYALGLYASGGILVNNFILPFSIVVFMWGLIHERTLLQKLLESKLFLLLGKSSYTFYLIHMGFIADILYKYVTHNYVYNFPVTVLISVILYKTTEEPLNHYFRNLRLRPASR